MYRTNVMNYSERLTHSMVNLLYCHMKVEADRGEDLGVVVSKSLVEDFVEFVPTAGYRGRGYSAGLGEKKYIIRFATTEERMLLRNKVEDEERTLQVISCATNTALIF